MRLHIEKREAQRIRVELPVHFDSGSGTTRDISRSGVYFLTEEPMAPGMAVNFSLELDYALPGEPMNLHCQGQILRIDSLKDKLGVAASIRDLHYAY